MNSFFALMSLLLIATTGGDLLLSLQYMSKKVI